MPFVLALEKNRTKELKKEKREGVNGRTGVMHPQLSLGKQGALSEQEDLVKGLEPVFSVRLRECYMGTMS